MRINLSYKHIVKRLILFSFLLVVVACTNAENTYSTSIETEPYEITPSLAAYIVSTTLPSNRQLVTPQSSPTTTSMRVPTMPLEPTTAPTFTPLPIESHTWEAPPVLIQFRPKVCVDVCYGETFSALPSLILYSDGLMIIDRQVGLEFQLQARQMSQNEVCALLNTIDLFGFLEYDPTEYFQKNQEYPRLQPSNYIEVNAWKSNNFDPGGLTDFLEGNILEGEVELDPALINTYRLLFKESRQDLAPYVPERIVVEVEKLNNEQVDVLFDSGVWPLEDISIEELFNKGIAVTDKKNTTRIILEGSEALTPFELFGQISAPPMRIYSEDAQPYAVSIRALLPDESMSSIGFAYGGQDIIPGPDVTYETTEITCLPEDGVVDFYYSVLKNEN